MQQAHTHIVPTSFAATRVFLQMCGSRLYMYRVWDNVKPAIESSGNMHTKKTELSLQKKKNI